MVLRDGAGWSPLPRISPQSPVLAVHASADGLWAGGFGTVARKPPGGEWILCSSSHAIRTVLALAEAGSTLFVAGVGGIARSADRGGTWLRGHGTDTHTVLCLAPSPEFGRDDILLAGTTDSGVLRSADGGVTWTPARFGMPADEVSALIWIDGQTVLAATPEGVYRSANAGRSWQLHVSQGFTLMSQAGERLVAMDTGGGCWHSDDSGEQWVALGSLPPEVAPQALAMLSDGSLLIGSIEHGMFHSGDGGTWNSWGNHHVLSFATTEHSVYAGTAEGVIERDEQDQEWLSTGSPPLFDHLRVEATGGEIRVIGVLSPPQRWSSSAGWVTLDACPLPVRAVATGWADQVLVTTPDGLFASDDGGETWQQRAAVPGGDFLTIRTDGSGWMATADGANLLITRDRGATWSPLRPPFGVLPVVALQAAPEPEDSPLLAVTFDVARQQATLWRSNDDGETWERGNDASTSWPVVATMANPLAVSIGNAIVLRGPDGIWMRTQPGRGNVRQMSSSPAGLAVLTQDGIWLKRPSDDAWLEVELPAPLNRIIDVDLDGELLVVLLTGGDVYSLRIDQPSLAAEAGGVPTAGA